MATIPGIDVINPGMSADQAVVEISLLLPANRLEALVALSRLKRQSVAQLLRGLIDRALAEEE